MLRLTVRKTVETSVAYTDVKYGLLYNWYAATDARNIAADGWSVPTNVRLQALSDYLGGDTVSGGKLKEMGTTYWQSPNTGATNEVFFNGRGGGRRSAPTGGLFDVTLGGQLYILSTYFSVTVQSFAMSYDNDNFGVAYRQRADGMSIRLIKTTTTLTHGQTGTYTGNDGKIYRTICIGTQEWLADNLCETKYRNGDTIPEVTNNAAWAVLTTGALCAYNNDWSNVLL